MSDAAAPVPAVSARIVVKFRVVREEEVALITLPGENALRHRHTLILGVSKTAALFVAQRLLGIAVNLPDGDKEHLLAPLVIDGELIEEHEARRVLGAVREKAKAGA